MSTLGFWLVGSLFVEALLVNLLWADSAVPRLYLRWGRNEPGRTALLVLATHACVAVVVVGVVVLAHHLQPLGADRTRFGLALVPGLAVLGPLSMVWMPGRFTGFRAARRDFERMGASAETARAFFWGGAVTGVVGFLVAVFGVFPFFSHARHTTDPMPGFASCGPDDAVMVTGEAPPCASVMQVVHEFERRHAAGRGQRSFDVRGFHCSADAGLVICWTRLTQLTFDLPS